jgi:hypothetical protein
MPPLPLLAVPEMAPTGVPAASEPIAIRKTITTASPNAIPCGTV